MLNKLILFLFVLASFSVGAQPASDTRQSTPEFLVQSQVPLANIDPYDLAISYSGKDYDNTLFDDYSKAYLISEIQRDQESKVKPPSNELHIPLGPSLDFSDLESELKTSKFYSVNLFRKYKREIREGTKNSLDTSINSLSESELKIFLSKKHEYLSDVATRLENLFIKLKVTPNYKFINGFIQSLNNMIYLRAPAFVNSNTFGIPLYLTVGFGSALGRLVYDLTIARSPLKKYINPNFGFYFLSAFGIAFSTTKIGDRKLRSLDLFFDFERFKQALTPVFEGFGGFGYGVHFESRGITTDKNGKTRVVSENSYNEAKYIPVVGMLKIGPKDFSLNHGLVVTAPLYSLFHDNHFSRKYWHFTYYDSEKPKMTPFWKRYLYSTLNFFNISSFPQTKGSMCLSAYR